jgi:hypothetical protein
MIRQSAWAKAWRFWALVWDTAVLYLYGLVTDRFGQGLA